MKSGLVMNMFILAAFKKFGGAPADLLGLFTGVPGARAWRRTLATRAVARGAGIEVVRDALGMLASGALLPQIVQ
jgi:hypothetical protein